VKNHFIDSCASSSWLVLLMWVVDCVCRLL